MRTVRVLVALALLLLACGGQGDGRPVYDRIVLVTLDTLRADRLGAYGYPRRTSPFLDGLAERGVVFDRAYSATSTTAPSHATLFTGLYPLQHGLERNGQSLPRDVETLAERLHRQGFLTAAFVGTRVHFTPGGLNRGFVYFDRPSVEESRPYRSADVTLAAARAWLEGCGSCDRLFLWVHLFDVHGPRHAPDEHVAALRVPTPERLRELADFYVHERGVPLDFFGGDAAQLVETMTAYDAELHFADAALARFYEGAMAQLRSPVLWIATADHGEGLGNHHFGGHGKHIYEEHVRVPLIFHASDGGLAPHRVASVVEHVDLAPTIQELAGDAAPPPPEATGRSLVPALLGQPLASRGAFVQRRTYASQEGELSEAERESYEPGLKFAVVEPRWKFVHRTEGEDELFDLASDPHELENLVGRRSDEAERLGKQLRERIDALGAQRRDAESVDDETIEQLRALGYVP